MDLMIDILKRLLPDVVEIIQKRYQILRYVKIMQPVGRRSLAQSLHMTERVLRGEIDFLKDQNLLSVSTAGMTITDEGIRILDVLAELMRGITSLPEVEREIKNLFQIQQSIVVSGDSDKSSWVKAEMGRACLNSIKKHLKEENIIAVTGGTTMAALADALTPDFGGKNLLFVPARGGIGTDVKNQANTICEKMAEKANAKHMVLYVPDQVSADVYDSFIHEPSISEVLNKIKSANILIHGIGDAITMAKRRKTSPEDLEKIEKGKAVTEAFGYYFNENGEIVHRVQTVGLKLEDLSHISHIYAVAGGTTKAKAIKAYMKIAPKNTVLVTDEAAARQLLKG